MAAYLGVPERVILKAPSADFWAGQTDEREMGFSYCDLDRYLTTEEAESFVRKHIETRRPHFTQALLAFIFQRFTMPH